MIDRGRRRFLQGLAATGMAMTARRVLAGCDCGAGRVVIIGGGFGGVTCARYLRELNPELEVLLVEPQRQYTTCPMSNLAIAGLKGMETLVHGYDTLTKKYGVRIFHDRAVAIDADIRVVRLADGPWLTYDRLIMAPGISFIWNSPAGYTQETAERMPHAWNAGPQTRILYEQLRAMPDGGVVAIAVPPAPFRCPPGPYERASLIAHYLQAHKPRAKLLLLDGNEYFSKQDIFEEAWAALYPGRIERIPVSGYGAVTRVDVRTGTLYTETDSYRADVANVIPSQRAGAIAIDAGLVDDKGWCPIDANTFESTLIPRIHVIGDAAMAHPIPKSASAANSQAKLCALAVVALLNGDTPPPASLHNTCYSYAAPDYAFSISGIYRANNGRIVATPEGGGVSPLAAPAEFRAREAGYARDWYRSIMQDSFGLKQAARRPHQANQGHPE